MAEAGISRRFLISLLVLAGVLAAPATTRAANRDIWTVAGDGTPGFSGDNGPAISAQLDGPRSVSAMPDGGFLITDRINNRIRRVWPNGTIATVAGSGPVDGINGTPGAFSGDGGPATDARLDFIHGAAPTPDGGFIIDDTRNQRVRYVSPSGTIGTVAGSGPFGTFGSGGFSGNGGPATSARLSNPHTTLAVDPDGSYMIADTDNNRIREVGTDGVIRTVAGSGPTGSQNGSFAGDGGPATAARLKRPFSVAPMPDGGFLLTDTGNQVVRRVLPDGTIITVAGTPGAPGYAGDKGPATQALLRSPHAAVPTPDGGMLIADAGNNVVRRVAADGTIRTVAGTGAAGYGGDGGPATQAALNSPKGVAVITGGFLIDDEVNHRIRLVQFDFSPPGSPAPAPSQPPLPVAPPSSISLKLLATIVHARRGERIRLPYTCSESAKARLVVSRRGRRVARLQRQAHAGRNRFTLRPALTRALTPGRYRLLLSVRSQDGQEARATGRLRIQRRP